MVHLQGGTETQSKGRGQNEAIPPRELHSRNNPHPRRGDGREEECSHATQHRRWDRDQCSGEFGQDSHEDEPEAACIARFAIRAACQSDDAVVLSESGHGCDGAETGYTICWLG